MYSIIKYYSTCVIINSVITKYKFVSVKEIRNITAMSKSCMMYIAIYCSNATVIMTPSKILIF